MKKQPQTAADSVRQNSSRRTISIQHTFVRNASTKWTEPQDCPRQDLNINAVTVDVTPQTTDAQTVAKSGRTNTVPTAQASAGETYTTLSEGQVHDLELKIREQEKQFLALFQELKNVLGIASQSGQRQRSTAKNKAVLDELRRMVHREKRA